MPTPDPAARVTRRYDLPGLHAIAHSAFGLEYAMSFIAPSQPFALIAEGAGAVVCIDGPLTYSGWPFCSYDGIRACVAAALASPATCVVLKINSPGGEVAGAFDCARALRAMARAAGKPLLAFTDAQAASSAYALASAADAVWASATGVVGSIGIVAAEVDATRADAMLGVAFAVVTSGARKSDGNPHVPFSEDMLRAVQARVDEAAGVFFQLVADHRGLGVDAIAALQAGVYLGASALNAGLIDRVASWDDVVSAVADGSLVATVSDSATLQTSAIAAQESPRMADDKKDDKDSAPKEDAVRAALVTAAASDDPDKAAKAKAALAAYDGDSDEGDDKKKKDGDSASAASASAAAGALGVLTAQVTALNARLEASEVERKRLAEADAAAKAAAERQALYASRPDLGADTIKALDAMTLEHARTTLALIPKGPAVTNPVAPPVVTPTLGATQGQGSGSVVTPGAVPINSLSERMGIVKPNTIMGCRDDGAVFYLGVPVPAAAPAPKGS